MKTTDIILQKALNKITRWQTDKSSLDVRTAVGWKTLVHSELLRHAMEFKKKVTLDVKLKKEKKS